MLKGQKKGEPAGSLITCPCGTATYATPALIRSGRKKYCSQKCKYAYRKRPSGLTYKIVKQNPTWVHVGERANPSYVPPKGVSFLPQYEFPKGIIPANFKGDDVGYMGLHSWVRRQLGAPKKCVHCGKTEGRLHWANVSWEYKRELDDWMALCPSCHSIYDRSGHFRAALDKYGARS